MLEFLVVFLLWRPLVIFRVLVFLLFTVQVRNREGRTIFREGHPAIFFVLDELSFTDKRLAPQLVHNNKVFESKRHDFFIKRE